MRPLPLTIGMFVFLVGLLMYAYYFTFEESTPISFIYVAVFSMTLGIFSFAMSYVLRDEK